MTKDEALKMALEALELHGKQYPHMVKGYCLDAITTIKEALAQPEQEPVVWMYVNRSTHETIFQRHMRSFVDHGNWTETPLYSEPLANHELNCVCGAVWCGDEMVHLPHKSTPPQRTWVGLTDEEVNDIVWSLPYEPSQEHIRAIEAKLKEKNT